MGPARQVDVTSADVIEILDADDPRVDDYRELNVPSARRRIEGDRIFVVEGPTALDRALASGHSVRSVLVDERRLDRILRDVTTSTRHRPVRVLTTSRETLRRIVGFDLHRGVVAVAERRPLRPIHEIAGTARRAVVLEGLNDPENVGAIARSARALGADAMVLDPTCIDPYYRRTVRVSMGEILHLGIARAERWPDELDQLASAGIELWAMSPDADADDLWALPVPDRVALVLGAEGPGLAAGTVSRCHRTVRIPISAGVDSLNVGAAAAVGLAVVSRPR